MERLFALHNIKVVTKEKIILNGINYTFMKGKVYGLLAQNGEGKTTLMKVIAGMIRPTSGEVEFFKESVRIGYSIENRLLFQNLTAETLLQYYSRILGCYSKENVDIVLDKIGLSGERKKRMAKYSEGMKQRLSFGVALLGKPDLLLLDEPVNAVDAVTSKKLNQEVIRYSQENQATVILSNHVGYELFEMSDEFIFVKHGQIQMCCTKKELFDKCQNDRSIIEKYFVDILEEK